LEGMVLPPTGGQHLEDSNFSGANLTNAVRQMNTLSDATSDFIFYNIWLDGVDFSGANLVNAKFGMVSLVGTNFSGADLRGASFTASSGPWDGANFDGADLSGADLGRGGVIGSICSAQWDGATWDDSTLWPGGHSFPCDQ